MKKLSDIFGKKNKLTQKDIHEYLDSNTGDSRMREIENIMSESPLNNDAMEGFQKFGKEALDDVPDFDSFRKRKLSQEPSARIKRISPMINRVAAMLIGVVIVAAGYMYWNENSSERTFAEFFENYNDPEMFALRDGNMPDGTKPDEALQKGTAYYLDQEYSKAIIYFDTFLKANPGNLQASFYLGMSYLQNNNHKKAKEYLSLVAGQESEHQDASKWFLALAQIKGKEKEEARKTLMDVAQNGKSFYADKAKKMLDSF